MILNKIKNSFDCVTADEELKSKTLAYIHNKKNKYSSRKIRFKRYFRYAVACTAAIFIFTGYGTYLLFTSPVSYISIDINPSFELALNRFDRVITASAYNDESREILSNIDLSGKSYIDAVDTLLSNSEMTPYLGENCELSFTVISENEEDLINGIQSCNGFNKYGGQCKSGNIDLKNEAIQSGLSFGKYKAYLELLQYDSSITTEDCKNMTMREINELINEYTNNTQSSQNDNNGIHYNHNNTNNNGGSKGSGNGKKHNK